MNIVITGGSKGIGKAIADKYASENHNILICARNADMLKDTSEELAGKYPSSSIQFFSADLSSRKGSGELALWIKEQNIAVDILINNAGTFLPGSIYNEPEGTLEEMINTNLYSAYHLTRALLPEMIKRKNGHIFNMCSIASMHAYANGGSYSISKYALDGFSKNLREELKPFDIKVTSVYPGAVYTDSWKASGLPEERFIKVEDIANLIYSASTLSPQACVEELIIRPMQGDID